MTIVVLRNDVDVLAQCSTLGRAREQLQQLTAQTEKELTARYGATRVRVSGNLDSSYLDVMNGDAVESRTYLRLEHI